MQLQAGRWPANVLHDGSDEVVGRFPVTSSGELNAGHKQGRGSFGHGGVIFRDYGNDAGSAARFFYTAKASRAEREAGLEHLNPVRRTDGRDKDIENPRLRTSERVNHHPTVKPLALMRWLVRLVTPPGGTVLDPFCGSGTTLLAARAEGAHAIGIEREAAYVTIAQGRLGMPPDAEEPADDGRPDVVETVPPHQPTLF